MAANAHALFYKPGGDDDFLHRLNLSDKELSRLRSARDAVRKQLIKAFQEWENFLTRDALFAATSQQSQQPPALSPRFRQQGSQSYHTANRPAWTPPQEVDLDDGLFLPTEMLGEAGQSEPAVLTGGLFTIVYNALSGLCRAHEWSVEKKNTCIRIRLNHGSAAHIDLPIYAIPEKQYRTLKEAIAAVKLNGKDQVVDDVVLAEEAYRQLASGEIMLAHLIDGWIRSDPRKLEDWFNDAVNRHGQQLRRVCRYLKAWRDHHWQKGGPSSIALMACVVAVYNSDPKGFDDKRDDLALLKVASQLSVLFNQQIANPAVPGLYLDHEWNKNGLRSEYVDAAHIFHIALNTALVESRSPEQVIAGLKPVFGERIPNNLDLVVFPAATPDEWLEATAALAPTVKPQDKRSYA